MKVKAHEHVVHFFQSPITFSFQTFTMVVLLGPIYVEEIWLVEQLYWWFQQTIRKLLGFPWKRLDQMG